MPLLTTAKIVACTRIFGEALRSRGCGKMLQEIETDPELSRLYEATTEAREYQAYMTESLEYRLDENPQMKSAIERGASYSREVSWLQPAEGFGYTPREAFYLIGEFKASLNDKERYHLRFENAGEHEIDSFHLTTEHSVSKVKLEGTKLRMTGHLYFTIEKGVISLDGRHHIRGGSKTKDQYSDVRMADYVLDVVVMMYYFMYKIKAI